MKLRTVAGALALALIAPTTAQAQDVVPLAGTGENIEPIARVKFPGANEVEMAGDWAFVSVDKGADGGEGGGLVIVNVADPRKPFVQARWDGRDAGLKGFAPGDIDLSPDGNLAYLTNAHGDVAEGEGVWVAILDVRDKSAPKLVGKIVDDGEMDYVHTSNLDGTTLYTNPQVAAFYPQQGNAAIGVYDVSDPTKPVKKGEISPPGADAGLAHDSYVDHRPDGTSRLYAASIDKSDVIDVTDPLKATWIQTAVSEYTVSHDVQPNFDRSLLIVDDEGLAGGQLSESVSACGKVGSGPASVDSGSIQFFQAAPDGTFADGGVVHLGTYNAPNRVNVGACVAHVFWQAPDENRLTQAYYRTGAFVLDFKDPSAPKELGWFVADGGAEYWSNKPHRGYLFASDMENGLDILRYTGEGGTRWPATAGPAEVQRAKRQGVPYVPIPTAGTAPLPDAGPSAPARELGAFRFTAKVKKVPGKAGRKTALKVSFFTARGRSVGGVSVKRTARKAASLPVQGVAVAGTYTWKVTGAGKVLARGRIVVKRGQDLALSPGRTLVASAK